MQPDNINYNSESDRDPLLYSEETNYKQDFSNSQTPAAQQQPKKDSKGMLIAVILLTFACLFLSLLAFVPGVREIFSSNDSVQQDSISTPDGLDAGMPLHLALQAEGVSLSIITSYEPISEPIHTLYLAFDGKSYETNITDADGGWCYLTSQGKDAMRYALSNAGIINNFNVDCIEQGAEILSVSDLSPKQIQQEKDKLRQQSGENLANVVHNFYESRNSSPAEYITPACMRRLMSLQKDADPIMGISNGEIYDEQFECIDAQRGLVKFTFMLRTIDGDTPACEIVSKGKTTFQIIKSSEGDYLIDSWTKPILSEVSRNIITESIVKNQ